MRIRPALRPAPLAGVALFGAGVLTAGLLAVPHLVPAAVADQALPGYADCPAFAAGMRTLALSRVGPYGFGTQYSPGDGVVTEKMAPPVPDWAPPVPAAAAPAAAPAAAAPAEASAAAPAAAAKAADSAQAVGTSATGTNVQETGVDEADLAKTDGKLLVAFHDNQLEVVDVRGSSPRPRGRVDLGGHRPTELLLDGDRVLVVSTHAGTRYDSADRGGTSLELVDIADPDHPRLISSEEVDAKYLSARLVDGVARVVVSAASALSFTRPGEWRDGDRLDEAGALAANKAIVADSRAADWIANRRVIDAVDRTAVTEPLVNCSDIRHPITDSGTDLLTVVSIDTHAARPLLDEASTAVVAAGDLVYASTDKLFVATTDGGWGAQWRTPGGPGTVTRIHAFDIAHGPARYLASGQVDGFLYGRWAMSERDGLLRLVTTDGAPWGWSGNNHSSVVVLDTAGRKLDELGRLDGVAPGEQVKAVRWFDDLAAIVTFRQTDPLQLVDLSHPTTPVLRGVLQVPGYSEYLHPIGDRRLLGVGRAGTEAGPTGGLGLASFDILDVTAPRQTDVLGLGRYANSPVEQDPRGFVYLPDARLAVFPVQPQNKCFTTAYVCSGVDGRIRLPHGPGLVSVRVAKDGGLSQIGTWTATQTYSAGDLKALPLPDGRIAVLDRTGVTLLRLADLGELGNALF